MHFYQFDEWEMYDLKFDPDELTNLYENPEHAAQGEKHKKQLAQIVAQYEDDSDMAEMPESWQKKVRPLE